MDFSLPEEARMLRDLCRDFADRAIRPHAAEWDRERHFPAELFLEMGELSLMGLLVPVEYGGTDVGTVAFAAAMEELAAADNSAAACWNAHLTIGSLPILHFGTEEQKRRWLVPLAKGEKLGSCAFTEPNAGSDLSGIETRARKTGKGWRLRGRKIFITNVGTEISLGPIVLARTAEKRFGFFVVPRGTPGLEIGPNAEKLGWRSMDTRELIFDDCFLPADHLIGESDVESIRQATETLAVGRISVAALSLGLARACLDASLAYALGRAQFGRPIASHQGIRFKLADMATRLEMARLITMKAAWLHDRDEPYRQEAAMAKLAASELAVDASREAVQIHGGYGYMEGEFPVARYYRDAKVLEIGEGTSEILRVVIAKGLGC
ncbi:MAG: acyl-CoA dehydrogenase family protein [Candidatus Tectomicrobia bacterium]|uniref:Acyl-CoA dehydrogenase family protein n=1 Tax=Tectimicrobiota bacterium TaxID=2528274 RepID=A0A933E8X8_UNCTE|nr:acyl-CoA dehydrogenase family protein [Candidatus Tectomicrobia bacterium]